MNSRPRSRRSNSYTGKRKSKIEKIIQKMISFAKAYCFDMGIDYSTHYPSRALLYHVHEAAQRMMEDYKYTQWSDVREHFDDNVQQYMNPILSFIDYEHSLGEFEHQYLP
jgi:hypothetical protein